MLILITVNWLFSIIWINNTDCDGVLSYRYGGKNMMVCSFVQWEANQFVKTEHFINLKKYLGYHTFLLEYAYKQPNSAHYPCKPGFHLLFGIHHSLWNANLRRYERHWKQDEIYVFKRKQRLSVSKIHEAT